MLKKIVLVATLALASFVSVNLAASRASTPAPTAVTWPGPECWATGACVN